jgi:methionine sulfoxide reductase heme-binding subunit
MNPHLWWYLSRAAGIVAYLMLTASVLWGTVLATDLFPKHRRPAWILALHRWLAGLTIFFIAGHLAGLVADSYAHFGARELLVPFASPWRPTAVAVGIIALYALFAVQVTALARKRLAGTWWRDIHLASYGVFWAVSIHGAFAGTDASQRLYVVASIAALSAVVFAVTYRVLSRDLPKRRPQRARARAARPAAAAKNEA